MIFEVKTNQTDYAFANTLSEVLKGYSELSEQNGFTSIEITEISEEKAKNIKVQFDDDKVVYTLSEIAKDYSEFTILFESEY